MPPAPPPAAFTATQIGNVLTALNIPASTQRALLQIFPGDTSTTTVYLEAVVVGFPLAGGTVVEFHYREVRADGSAITYSRMVTF